MSASSSVVSTLAVGIPSVIVAAASYVFAVRAHRQQLAAAGRAGDAAGIRAESDAYARARVMDEEVITELRRQGSELRADLAGVKADLAGVRDQLRQAQAVIDELRGEVAMLRAGGGRS